MAAAVGICGCVLFALVASFAVAPSLCWCGSERAAASVELRPSGRGKALTAADGDGLCCRRSDGNTSPVSQLTEMDEGRTASLSPLFVLSVHCGHNRRAASARLPSGSLWANQTVQSAWTVFPVFECRRRASLCFLLCAMPCAPGAAACCTMPTRVNEKRCFDCWRPASSPPHLRTTNTNTFRTRLMAGGCNAATWSASALVCCARHRDRSVMQPFGNRGGASGHVAFCRGSATRHGGCTGLCGMCEGDGVTDFIASALLCVDGCNLMVIVYDRMPLRATVFVYCCCCLLFLF
ncbi:putative retrotransposon hot spot (RHS) protein [Trypanosoma cruzi]|uniref:Uncharacterized protein n=1 Tax=Trypanosoma cruzi (strain CL Brener) TaxID=353153 RepID=Q4DCI1_TRYCC|nr:hypothetical protein Tc00.1047053511469.105 [Trypanosoma cruzi]EAN90244.1 hypothetical protein Tc00.1047053511469.105 [Trypanosoma cruzi]RNC61110.1 putative retrotransposon hot spot (RHS) protein [Trypanosoma cruzi]|eukprot:XP_812095.1 hypothetical protein [Trypanosoma cruzi strain CL Brener]